MATPDISRSVFEAYMARVHMQDVRARLIAAADILERAEFNLWNDEPFEKTEAEFREEAVRFVLDAMLASIGWRGLNRKRFQILVVNEGRQTPSEGPAAVKHAVLLTEARKALRCRS